MAKRELLAPIPDRYRASSRKDKSRILDEFIAVTGHHRKHGIRLLGQSGDTDDKVPDVKGRRIYDETVRAAVILVWEASDRICDKRLKAALPHLVESMERHGHLDLDSEVRARPMTTSAVGTFRCVPRLSIFDADWNKPPPGFLEFDLVAHCGDNMGGSFVYSLVATDVCTGWTETAPLLAREQSLVVAGLEAITKQLPFPVLGIDSDQC